MRVLRSLVLGAATVLLLSGAAMAKKAPPVDPAPVDPAPVVQPAPTTGPQTYVPKASAKPSLPFPYGRTFVAVTYKDQPFKDDRPTFRLSSQNRGTGWSACNNWSATVIARFDQRMVMGPVAVTKRTCDARLMHNEQVFLFVLRTSQAWSYDGKTLTLNGPYGTMTLEPSA